LHAVLVGGAGQHVPGLLVALREVLPDPVQQLRDDGAALVK
jgi:hypothetical protein